MYNVSVELVGSDSERETDEWMIRLTRTVIVFFRKVRGQFQRNIHFVLITKYSAGLE